MYRRIATLILLACLLHQNSVYSQANRAGSLLRVHVPVENEMHAELLERLRGQTSDLAIELSGFKRIDPGAAFGADDALSYCHKSGAEAVVWAAPEQPTVWTSWRIGVTTCGDATSLLRQIETKRPAQAGSSGAFEAVALVLRGALGLLAQGGRLGVTAPVSGAESPPTAVSRLEATSSPSAISATVPAARPGSPTAPAKSSPAADGVPIAASLLFGWGQTWDGTADFGKSALHVALALGKEKFQLGLTGSLGIGITHIDRYAEITLTRHTLALQWRQPLLREPAWSLTAGVDLGSAIYYRTTLVPPKSFASARAAKLVASPLLGPWASAARNVGPIWVVLSAGVDGLLLVPRFVYSDKQMPKEETVIKLWPVCPRIVLWLGMGGP